MKLGPPAKFTGKGFLSQALSQSISTLLSTSSRHPGHSSGDSSNCFDESFVPVGFLQQTCTTNYRQQDAIDRVET